MTTAAVKIECIGPDWDAPSAVRACVTTRRGGVSRGPWHSLNLGDHVEDVASDVVENRARLSVQLGLPAAPRWLNQVHGTRVCLPQEKPGCADAGVTDRPGQVCAVLTADCLPVFFCNDQGTHVGVAHAGWRGLLAGVLEQTLATFDGSSGRLMAWLGPAIGPTAFEVGDEVRAAFVASDAGSADDFRPHAEGRWLADLYGLARRRLAGRVAEVSGGSYCTFSEPERFFSYRRDGVTGRMASLIWLQP